MVSNWNDQLLYLSDDDDDDDDDDYRFFCGMVDR